MTRFRVTALPTGRPTAKATRGGASPGSQMAVTLPRVARWPTVWSCPKVRRSRRRQIRPTTGVVPCDAGTESQPGRLGRTSVCGSRVVWTASERWVDRYVSTGDSSSGRLVPRHHHQDDRPETGWTTFPWTRWQPEEHTAIWAQICGDHRSRSPDPQDDRGAGPSTTNVMRHATGSARFPGPVPSDRTVPWWASKRSHGSPVRRLAVVDPLYPQMWRVLWKKPEGAACRKQPRSGPHVRT